MVVICVTSPPVVEVRNSPINDCGPKIITPPALLQAPPKGSGTSQSVCTGPPVTSIFLSLLSAKKPMKRLSGDQKGKIAPCVPASSLASVESSGRTQSWSLPPVAAVKARWRPSGDTAIWPKLDFSGGRMENLINLASLVTGWRVKYAHTDPSITSKNATVASHASRSRIRKDDATTLSATTGAAARVSNCDSGREPDGADNASSAKQRSLAD